MFHSVTAAIHKSRKWLIMLAGIVVFVVTYALILPAITIDNETAEEEPGLEIVLQESEIADENGAAPDEGEADMPAVVLEQTRGDVSVKVEADAGVFPADTRMVLDDVSDAQALDPIENAVPDPVKDVQAVKVAFVDADGEPVEPLDSFTLTVGSAAAEDDARVLVAVDKDGGASVLGQTTEMIVAPDGAPVLALVEMTLTTSYLSDSGNTYEATVAYTSAAKLPAGAALRLTEIEKDTPAYNAALQALLDADVIPDAAEGVTDGEGSLTGAPVLPVTVDAETDEADDSPLAKGVELDVLDLAIVDEDGNEIEPAAPVHVEIVMKSLPGDVDPSGFYSSVTVTHLCETDSGVQPQIVAGNGAGLPGEISVENGEATAIFETDSFSQYTVTWRTSNSMTVHYGYMNGDTFVEFDPSVFSHGTPNIRQSNAPNYLIYDVDGWEFSNAYRQRGSTKTAVQPYLSYSSSNYRYWDTNGTAHGMSSTGDHIYMVYTPKATPPAGGTPLVIESGTPPAPPEILKTSTNNHDGTRELSLSITGHEEPMEFLKMMDLILVFDVSGSMKNNMTGGTATASDPSRLDRAKRAIKYLSDELLSDDRVNNEGEKLNRMALVTFSDSAQVEQGFTSDPTVYDQAVDNMTALGGTNWEKSLQIANELDVDPDRATVVIFVTDGNPTWRMTRYNVSDANLRSQNDVWPSSSENSSYYRNYNVFGRGISDEQNRNYNAALLQAQSIVNLGKSFYSVGISSDVTNLEDFTEDAGVPRANSYTAENEEDLLIALMDIIDKMEAKSGFGNVNMIDGITGLTNLLAKTPVSGVVTDDFTYTKTKNGVTTSWDPASEGASPATYNPDTNAVEWNMGSGFQLEDGVTYTVSFKVWPSQLASDIVTDLNNGKLSYDELEPEIQAQIHEANGYYTVKTNEDDAHVTYYKSKKTNGVVEPVGEPQPPIYFQEVPPLVVETMPMTLKKVFRDSFGDETGDGIGADRPEDIHLRLEYRPMGSTSEEDWLPYEITYVNAGGDTVTSWDIWLSAANNWQAQFYVSPGLRDADQTHLNEGHEYRLTEIGLDYHYELISEYLNPYLQGHDSPVEGIDPRLVEEEVYVVREYGGDTDGDEALTAVNEVKGGINLFKHVNANGADVDPDTEFTIRGWILDPDGNPYLFDQANDDRTDKSKKADPDTTPLFYAHQNDPLPYHFYDKDGVRVVYKGHFDSTQYIEFKIKDGEQIRFPIIPSGCTYLFWEVDGEGMPTGFMLENVTGVARENLDLDGDGKYEFVDSSDLSKYPVVNEDNEVGGTIYGNTLFQLDFYNRFIKPNRITVNKKLTNADGTVQIYPDKTFTVKGYIRNRFGIGYTFDPTLDDRTDKSQPLPESEYDTHTWDEHQDDPIAYNIIDKDGNYVVYKGHFPSTDSITFELRSGDTIEFLNVPDNNSYQFYEDTGEFELPGSIFEYVSSSGEAVLIDGGTPMQPTTFPNSDGYTVVAGTVHENEEHNIHIENKINVEVVDLRVRKVDAENPERKLNGAEFRLYADEDHMIPATDFNGNLIGTIVTGGFADDDPTRPLGIGYVGKLLPGTYYLVETAAPDGYSAPAGHVIVTIDTNGSVSILQEDNAQQSQNVYVENGVVTIVITNNTGKELPSTGGPGTFLYTSGGLLLMAAAMIYLIRVRRRERRLE